MVDTSTSARPEAPPAELLIDRHLPRCDVALVEHTLVDADPATTWRALRELDLARVHTPLMDAAMTVRDLPRRMAGLLGPGARPAIPARLPLGGGGPALPGWLPLGEVAGREIALGAIGRFWQPDIEWYDVTGMTPEAFAAFDEPGWGRIAASFSVLAYTPSRTLVSYEVRTATPDPDTARRFARYWRLIRPFVAHIMRAALATLREELRQPDPADGAVPGRADGHGWLAGLLGPVDYSATTPYRPTPRLYRRMQPLGWLLTRLGLSPGYAVLLEVPGRRTGTIRRTQLVRVDLDDQHFLVSLAGESEWVRNVRAAGGRVVLGRRERRAATLVEVPTAQRPPILRAYLGRPGATGRSWGRAAEARHYFGVDAEPTDEQLREIADRYPSFRIRDDAPS